MNSAIPPIVVMGVAGCGKTTIGALLAARLEVPLTEADALHPQSNVEKMARGTPLTDDDRLPWLESISRQISANTHNGIVVSCSALRRSYRDILREANDRTWFLHLALDQRTAIQRVAARPNHFMPPSLVNSQFETLEGLTEEAGLTVDATNDPAQLVIIATENAESARLAPEARSGTSR